MFLCVLKLEIRFEILIERVYRFGLKKNNKLCLIVVKFNRFLYWEMVCKCFYKFKDMYIFIGE